MKKSSLWLFVIIAQLFALVVHFFVMVYGRETDTFSLALQCVNVFLALFVEVLGIINYIRAKNEENQNNR